MQLMKRIENSLNWRFEYLRQVINRKRLKNRDFTIFSSNCVGGSIYHSLGLRFDSPTINLYFHPGDFLKFCKRPFHYLNQNLQFFKDNTVQFPVAMLDDITIYFMHYKTNEEAESKWIERTKRIHYDNVFFIFTDQGGCTKDQLREFDSIPHNSKIVFTARKYDEFCSSYYMKAFKKNLSVGDITSWKNHVLGKKYYDDFDYVKWLNQGGCKIGTK